MSQVKIFAGLLLSATFTNHHNNNNNANIERFIEEISPIINSLQKENKYAAIVGDFNINPLQINEREKFKEFFDFMCTDNFFPKITLPIRSSKKSCTLIDQMFCKSPHLDNTNISASIIMSKISYLFPCLVKLETLKDPNIYKSASYQKQQLIILERSFVLQTYRRIWMQTWWQTLILCMIFLNGLLWTLTGSISPINVLRWTNININSLLGSQQGESNPLNSVTSYISDYDLAPRTALNTIGWNTI